MKKSWRSAGPTRPPGGEQVERFGWLGRFGGGFGVGFTFELGVAFG